MDEYFASLPTDEIGQKLVEKTEQYYNFIQSNGYLGLWKKTHLMFYNGFYIKGEILSAGKQGEKSYTSVNNFRSILEHIKVLTADQRPVFEPKAVNSDHKSAAQVNLARGLLDYYMRQENLEEVIGGCMDYALISGEGYIFQEWDSSRGKVVGELETTEESTEDVSQELSVEDEIETEIKHEGNIVSCSLHPVDVTRDIFKDSTENNEWYIVRRKVNKFELAAKYPKFENEIINNEIDSTNVMYRSIDDFDFRQFADSDQAYMFILRHAKTAALPEGRQVEFLADSTILFDGDLPYSNLSIYRMMPNVRRGSNFGYTIAYDLLPLQSIGDMLNSTIVTNQNTFGIQNVLTQKGSGLTLTELTGGLNKIEYSGDQKPEPLNLLSTPAEIFNYNDKVEKQMETISGVNSVARGNPEASLRSGSALALVQSMAIQFNSGLQQSYAQMLEQVGSGIISMLKDYADAPRVALIAGISKKAYLKEFKGEDLDMIDRVIVDVGNPLAKTLAGRQQIADSLVERGLIDSPEQFLQVLETGHLDPLIEGKSAEIMNIRSENERLTNGEPVSAIYTDNHWLHIKEHKNVLSSPDSRKEGDVVKITLAHINEHIQLLRSTDPGILMILGQQPIPSPANTPEGGMQSPMVPGQPEDQTPQQGQIGTPPPGGPAAPPSGQGNSGIGDVRMPNQPTNPISGNKFNLEDGGL